MEPSATNRAYVACGLDIGCVEGMLERMFYAVRSSTPSHTLIISIPQKYPNTSLLHPLVKAMTDRDQSRIPSTRETHYTWLGIKETLNQFYVKFKVSIVRCTVFIVDRWNYTCVEIVNDTSDG